ncbi:MAG: HEAT repeat domain-containing protein [Proteobacteria bacterium]|nr:HEAT repeat domain-containing protein [Pseudomonadota bacterium]
MALGAVGTRGQLNAVVARLSDRDLEVRLVAVRLLGESGHARAVATLLPLLRDANAMMRQTAAQALQTLGRSPWQQRQAESAAHFEAELRRLADPAPQARAEAARELGRSGSVRAAGALRRRLGAARESTTVVGAALRALVRVDPAAASRAVHELARAADPARRVLAVSVAGRLRPVAWELLAGALVDPQPEVRGAALHGLVRLRLAAPAALAAALCAALELEAERSLRLLAAQAAGAQHLRCEQQARALEARAREALGVAEPSAELARTLVDSFDLLARLRRAGDSALLIALVQRAAIVRQWESEPWISAERWRAGDSPSVALGATRGAATGAEAPPKDPGQALRWLLARFPVRESDSREQPLLPPTGSVGDLAERLVWLPPTPETRVWLAQVARDAADEVLAAAALDRLAEGAPPRSLSGNVASRPSARRGEHRSGAYGLVREHRSTAATRRSGGAAISRQAPSPDARGPAAGAVPASLLQQAVERGLASSEPLRRRAATGACVALPPPLGEVRALALVKDADGAVREAAALVLGRLRVREALPVLLALLAREPSPALVQALALLGDRRATRPLLRMLDEDQVGPRLGERLVVVQALGELADPAAAPALERELAHADGRLRRAAARALARAGRTRSIEALRVCAADYYAAVRQACAAAGERLTAARRVAP